MFQRRKNGHEDFYRDWKDYKTGFGQLDSDFWLGEHHAFIFYELILCQLLDIILLNQSVKKADLYSAP